MPAVSPSNEINIEFHHIQMYADSLKSVEHYKTLEKQSNDFSKQWNNGSVAKGQEVYEKVTGKKPKPEAYTSYGQDGPVISFFRFFNNILILFHFFIV